MTHGNVRSAQKLEARQRYACIALFIAGGLTVIIGLAAEIGHVAALLQAFGSGWAVAVEGAILPVLGYFTMRGSLIALGIAVALYAIDVLASLALGAISGIVLRLAVLFFLVRGFLAMRELRRRRSATSRSRPDPQVHPRQLAHIHKLV